MISINDYINESLNKENKRRGKRSKRKAFNFKQKKLFSRHKLFEDSDTDGYTTKILQDVTVKYGVHNNDIVIEKPVDYLEDNMMIYLQDRVANNLFTNSKFAKDFFGKNADNIVDTYFEWSGYDKTYTAIDLPFDSHYDFSGKDDETKNMERIKYKNFYYVVKFEKFELLDKEDSDIKEALYTIFNRPVSKEYTWPIKLELDYNNISYN